MYDSAAYVDQANSEMWPEHRITIFGYGHGSDPIAAFRHTVWLVDHDALLNAPDPETFVPSTNKTWIEMCPAVAKGESLASFGDTPTGYWAGGANRIKSYDRNQFSYTDPAHAISIPSIGATPAITASVSGGPPFTSLFCMYIGDIYASTATTSTYAHRLVIPSGDKLLKLGVPATTYLTLIVASQKIRGSSANDTAANIAITPSPSGYMFANESTILGKTPVEVSAFTTRVPVTTNFEGKAQPLLVTNNLSSVEYTIPPNEDEVSIGHLSMSLDGFNGTQVTDALPVSNPSQKPIWVLTNEAYSATQ